MEKIIRYGNHSAKLYVYNIGALLVTDEKSLPVRLSDALDEVEGIRVLSVQMGDNGFGCLGMTHSLSSGDLLAGVCDAIARVYNTDIAVSNARS